MKLFQFTQNGKTKCGVEINGERWSAAKFFKIYDGRFFESGGIEKLKELAKNGQLSPIKSKKIAFSAPFGTPSKIVCIGLNYADHAKESGMAIPPEPVIFLKVSTAFAGPFDNIVIPRNSVKTDWEVELSVVIGKKASYVEENEAMDYVAGYCVHNDVSEREFQLERSGQWDKGKCCDTFAPMGPYLVTPDEVKDVNNLKLWLKVNGEMVQNSNTSQLVYKIPFLISYVSQFMTLLAGDVISTGTPPGVGLGFNPPRYLKAGDVVELGIDGLGEAKQVCVNWSR